jgi:hypothetical protein
MGFFEVVDVFLCHIIPPVMTIIVVISHTLMSIQAQSGVRKEKFCENAFS